VATQLRKAVQMHAYKVEGTPALGIGGRFYTDGSMAGGFEHGQARQPVDRAGAQERLRHR
jgi:thiol:disulfide interchange protein DsbA